MAGAGCPFYMPALWPGGNLSYAFSKPEDEKPVINKAVPYLDIWGHLTSMMASSRSAMLGWLIIYGGSTDYPAFGAAKTISLDWILPIIIRNLAATWLICGFWDWFLYFSPLKEKLRKYKMNQTYPSMEQFKHDAFYSTVGSIAAAIIEIILCYGWATGAINMERNLWDHPIRNFILAITITHWRIPHFYAMHRVMHPWKTTLVPDVGKFLYRHVHSLHHKSYNPTAFSGTSMHPIESTSYYTAGLIPVMFGLHPIFALGCIIDCAMGAWLGHDGFQWPGSGDYFHLLHHKHFDCNYGAMHIPLDWLFGTYAGCSQDVIKNWAGRPAGEKFNTTPIHPSSNDKDKVY